MAVGDVTLYSPQQAWTGNGPYNVDNYYRHKIDFLDDTKVVSVILHRTGTSNYYLKCKIGNVSGTSITFGSSQNIAYNAYGFGDIKILGLSSSSFMVAYKKEVYNSTSYDYYFRVITIDGSDVITVGGEVSINSDSAYSTSYDFVKLSDNVFAYTVASYDNDYVEGWIRVYNNGPVSSSQFIDWYQGFSDTYQVINFDSENLVVTGRDAGGTFVQRFHFADNTWTIGNKIYLPFYTLNIVRLSSTRAICFSGAGGAFDEYVVVNFDGSDISLGTSKTHTGLTYAELASEFSENMLVVIDDLNPGHALKSINVDSNDDITIKSATLLDIDVAGLGSNNMNQDGDYGCIFVNSLGQGISTWSISFDGLYRVFEVETFVPYEETYTGSGTISYSGAATTSLEVGETYTGSGSITYSGTAVEEVGYVTDASGVITYSGIAATDLELSYEGEGLITYSGATIEQVDYVASASGSITFSGAAVTGVPVDYVYRETVPSTFHPSNNIIQTVSTSIVGSASLSNSINEKFVLTYHDSTDGGQLQARSLFQNGTDLYGPTYTFRAGNTVDTYNRQADACLLTDTLGVVAYAASSGNDTVHTDQYIQTFSLGGSFGITTTLNLLNTYNIYEARNVRLRQLTSTKFLMTYWSFQEGTSVTSLYARVGTVVNNDSISFGTELLITDEADSTQDNAYDVDVLDSGTVVLAYQGTFNNYEQIVVLEISGSTVTIGPSDFLGIGTGISIALSRISSTEFAIVGNTAWDGFKKCTISGSSLVFSDLIFNSAVDVGNYVDIKYSGSRLSILGEGYGEMVYYSPLNNRMDRFSNGGETLSTDMEDVNIEILTTDVYVIAYTDSADGGKLKSAVIHTRTPYQLIGGITFTGESQLQSDFIYNPSGDVTFSGSATEEVAYFVTGSGSITYSGTADTDLEISYTPTGGITYSGDAQPYIELTMITGGSIAFSGSALAQTDQVYFASGSIEFGGFAVIARDINETGSGSITFSGEVQGERDFAYETSGGITYSGKAMLQTDSYYVASGSIEFSGSAPFITPTNFEYVTTGGIEFSGSAEQYIDFLRYEGSGSIAYSGSADEYIGVIYNPSGSIEYLGEAEVQRGYSYTAQGFITYSGIAPGEEFNKYAYIGSGNIHYSGVTVRQVDIYESGSGVITFTGEASLIIDIYKYTGAGLLEFGGAATYVLLQDSMESITVDSYITTKITVDGLITRKLTVESLL